MAQYDFGNIDPYVVDGVQLADIINQWRDALYGLQRGPSLPSFAVPGFFWINDSSGPNAWKVDLYGGPGGGNVTLFKIDTVAGTATLPQAVQAVTQSNPADAT